MKLNKFDCRKERESIISFGILVKKELNPMLSWGGGYCGSFQLLLDELLLDEVLYQPVIPHCIKNKDQGTQIGMNISTRNINSRKYKLDFQTCPQSNFLFFKLLQ